MTTEIAQTDGDVGSHEAGQDSDRQVVVFRLSTERYGVDIGTVREIIRRQTVTRVPSAPDSVEGLINLRGRTIPVVDLCRRLNLSIAEETDASRIIVLDTGAADIGVFVDEVMVVLRVPQDSISDVASIAARPDSSYLDGIAQVNDTLLMLLDLDEALSVESLRSFKAKVFATEIVDEPEAADDETDEATEGEADEELAEPTAEADEVPAVASESEPDEPEVPTAEAEVESEPDAPEAPTAEAEAESEPDAPEAPTAGAEPEAEPEPESPTAEAEAASEPDGAHSQPIEFAPAEHEPIEGTAASEDDVELDMDLEPDPEADGPAAEDAEPEEEAA